MLYWKLAVHGAIDREILSQVFPGTTNPGIPTDLKFITAFNQALKINHAFAGVSIKTNTGLLDEIQAKNSRKELAAGLSEHNNRIEARVREELDGMTYCETATIFRALDYDIVTGVIPDGVEDALERYRKILEAESSLRDELTGPDALEYWNGTKKLVLETCEEWLKGRADETEWTSIKSG